MIKRIFIFMANFIYMFFKILPTKNRITMISRQSNNITTDFKLMKDNFEKNHKDISVIVLCHKLEGGEKASVRNKIEYIFHCFKQMYYISTSKVLVLDSYCILASILKHRKSLKIIQMWHSMGTMKRFGYQILGMQEGSSLKTAKIMKMHQNYTYAFASSENYAKYLAEGFGCSTDIIKIFSLPRVDLLTSKEYKEKISSRIIEMYPKIREKRNIVYCPTFRKNEDQMQKEIEKLIDAIDYEKYNLILKLHPLSKIKIDNSNVIYDKSFSSFDMLFIADYVISDYSCIIYEAAILNIPLYFWIFDFNQYIGARGVTFNYKKEVPGLVCRDINKIINSIENEKYDMKKLENFRKKYVTNIENCTDKICDFVYKLMQ